MEFHLVLLFFCLSVSFLCIATLMEKRRVFDKFISSLGTFFPPFLLPNHLGHGEESFYLWLSDKTPPCWRGFVRTKHSRGPPFLRAILFLPLEKTRFNGTTLFGY